MPNVNGTVPAASKSAAGTGGSASGGDRRERIVAGHGAIRGRDLPPPGDAELLSQRIAVRLRRPRRDAEAFADFLVRTAGCDECDDLALASGDLRNAIG